MKKIELNTLSGYAVLLLIGIITSSIGIFLVISLKPETPLPPPNTTSTPIVVPPQPSDYPDFDSVKSPSSTFKILNITDAPFISWTPDADKNKAIAINTKLYRKGGKLSAAYLYIKVSREGKPFTQWDSIYLKLNDVGGHLFRPQTLPIPPGDKTELLYAMNYVPYLKSTPYSESKTPLVVDWFTILNNSTTISLFTFISSLHESTIEEMTIYYQCVKEEDCELTK